MSTGTAGHMHAQPQEGCAARRAEEHSVSPVRSMLSPSVSRLGKTSTVGNGRKTTLFFFLWTGAAASTASSSPDGVEEATIGALGSMM